MTSTNLQATITPSKSGQGLKDKINWLNYMYQLDLDRDDKTYSPSASANELTDSVYGLIKRFYFTDEPELRTALLTFGRETNDGQTKVERLKLLQKTLKDIDLQKAHRHGTRADSQSPGLRNRGSARGLEVPRPSRLVGAGPQPSPLKIPFYPKAVLSESPGAEDPISATGENDEVPGTPDPGSDTDEDEFYTIQSPSTSIVRPSSPVVSPSRKRSLDSSQSSGSPKHARRSLKQHSGNELSTQRSHIGDFAFKKPTLEMARSYQTSSFGRSLDTAVVSGHTSFTTLNSSQQTQIDTPMSSFPSVSYSRVEYPKLPPAMSRDREHRPVSPMKGSLDDEDRAAAEANAQLQRESEWSRLMEHSRQATERGSTSTYDSVDEAEMLENSSKLEVKGPRKPLPNAESLQRKPLVTPRKIFPQGPSSEASPFNRSPRNALAGTSESSSSRSELEPDLIATDPQKVSHQSPSKLSYWIRNIPDGDLFMDKIPENLKRFPYFVLFISARLATEHSISLTQLLHNIDAKTSIYNPKEFLDQLCINAKIPCGSLSTQLKFWSARKDFAGYTFKARIKLDPSHKKTAFCLEVHPIATERSCRFERKFGSDRFLYVSVPAFEHVTARFTKQEMLDISERWKAWCHREHSFLGRQWRVFHLEPIDKRNKRRVEEKWDKRVILFATRGIGIDQPMSIGDMMNWFFPFRRNRKQTYCKAFSRLDLGLSRTIPTLVFKPSEIWYTKDKKSDGAPEQTKYNDPNIRWPGALGERQVMDDGCALMSVGAAMKIWKIVKEATSSDEPMPSAFQGRIGGAKGVWMIDHEHSTFASEDDVWIHITQSQLKFKPHKEDMDQSDEYYDRHRTTFDYLKHSHPPDASELHKLFVPILIDRGVPPDVLANIMVEYLNTERDDLMENLSNPERMYHWIHRESPSSSASNTRWRGALPEYNPNMIKFLFESGFQPDQEPFFASCVLKFIEKRQIKLESQLRVPLCKSTFVLGVADPLGVLAPGEVHMEFSTPFTDKSTGARVRDLNNLDVLVSRQPACRRSDIQRVRAVKHPELSHLIDVIVFPSSGQHPLAGKLQGGDYDGDTFWICWEQAIVQPFRNAPAPMDLGPTKYNIKQDKTKVSDLMDPRDLSTADIFLQKSLEFRMKPTILGLVTVFLEKQAYRENKVMSDCLDKLCDMHDLLVDAPKQGYTYTIAEFNEFTRKTLGLCPPPMPAYKQAMEDCEKESDDINPRKPDYELNETNVLDYLYFKVVRAHDSETLKMVKKVLSKEVPHDATLQYPYLHLRKTGSKVVCEELDALVKSLKGVRSIWNAHWKGNRIQELDHKLSRFDEIFERCYQAYCAILPTKVDHPDVKPWVSHYRQPNNFLWDDIRASALYANVMTGRFVWYMAGKQLAKLKAESVPNSTMVVPNIKAIMRPRPPKIPRLEDDGHDSDYESAPEE